MFFNLYDSTGHSEQKSLGASEAHSSHGKCKSALLIACAIGVNSHLWRECLEEKEQMDNAPNMPHPFFVCRNGRGSGVALGLRVCS